MLKILCNIRVYPMMFSFQEAHHYQMMEAVRLWMLCSYNGYSKSPLSISRHTVVGIDRCHNCFKSCHEIFDSHGRNWINMILQVFPQGKIHQLDPVIQESMKLALNIHYALMDMLHSGTARYLLCSALEPCTCKWCSLSQQDGDAT